MSTKNIISESENFDKNFSKNPENPPNAERKNFSKNNAAPDTQAEKTGKKKFYKNYKHHNKPLNDEQKKNLNALVDAIESAGIDEFMEYIRSPWRLLWPNFVAGVARGIGALVGAAAVLALIGWILTKIIDLPLIGARLEPYIQEVQEEITKYTESTNYNKNFQNIERVMTEIRDELKKQNQNMRNF